MLDASEKVTPPWTRKLPILNMKTPKKNFRKKQAEKIPLKTHFRQQCFPLIKTGLDSAKERHSIPSASSFIEGSSTKESLGIFCAPKKTKVNVARKSFKSPTTLLPFPPTRSSNSERKNFKSIESRFGDKESVDLEDVSFGHLDNRFYSPENIFKSVE